MENPMFNIDDEQGYQHFRYRKAHGTLLFFSYWISTIITDKYQNHSIYHEDFCWYSFFISKESHLLVYTENGDLMVI